MKTLQNLGLSDLFFNHRLDNYDALPHNSKTVTVTDEMVRAAILQDAKDFCALLNASYGIAEDPAELVDDFMNRV